MLSTIQPIDLAWTLICIVGLAASARLVLAMHRRRRAVRASGTNGARKLMAWRTLRNESGKLIFFSLGLLAGVVALADYPVNVRWLVVAGTACIAATSALSVRDEETLMALLRDAEDAAE